MLQNELFYQACDEDSNGELVFDEKIPKTKKRKGGEK